MGRSGAGSRSHKLAGATVSLALIVAACASPRASLAPSVSSSPSSSGISTPGATAAPSLPPPSPVFASPPSSAAAWHVVPLAPSGTVQGMIRATDGSYLAFGSADWNGALWRSTDGMTWTRIDGVPPVAPNEAKGLSGVIQTADGFLAWGGGGARYSEGGFSVIWTSSDGVAWVETARWTGFLVKVLVGGPGFVGVGSEAGLDNLYGALAWSSADGTTWNDSPPVPGDGGTGMLDVVSTPTGFVAIGGSRGDDGWTRGIAWRSQDGITWTVASEGELDGALSKALVTGGQLIAGGSITVDPINGGLERPAILVSSDASTWTTSYARNCCGYVTDLIAVDDGLLASYRFWVPEGASGVALIRSRDGATWDEMGTPALDSGVVWVRLMHLGGSLGVFGLGIRDIGNDEHQPVLLLPPADLL